MVAMVSVGMVAMVSVGMMAMVSVGMVAVVSMFVVIAMVPMFAMVSMFMTIAMGLMTIMPTVTMMSVMSMAVTMTMAMRFKLKRMCLRPFMPSPLEVSTLFHEVCAYSQDECRNEHRHHHPCREDPQCTLDHRLWNEGQQLIAQGTEVFGACPSGLLALDHS